MCPTRLRLKSWQKCKVNICFNQKSILPKCAALCNNMLRLLLRLLQQYAQISCFDAASDRATKVELGRQISSFGSYKLSSYDQNRLYFLLFAPGRRKYETAKSPTSNCMVKISKTKYSFEQIFYNPSIQRSISSIKINFNICD